MSQLIFWLIQIELLSGNRCFNSHWRSSSVPSERDYIGSDRETEGGR